MYTSIDMTMGAASIRNFLHTNKEGLPSDFPTNLFLDILEIIMRNNIFSFADTYWLQLSGTAMGTPAPCAYAMLTFGHFENTVLLPAFKDNLIYYRCHIDDVFGVWLPPKLNKSSTWNNFKSAIKNWGILKWEVEEPSTQTQFLDLNIIIQDSSVLFSTNQKPLNLYLYIPPLSAHPLSCLMGLIKGKLSRYWLQNQPTDFQRVVTKCIEKLNARGNSTEHLNPLLLQGTASIDSQQKSQI